MTKEKFIYNANQLQAVYDTMQVIEEATKKKIFKLEDMGIKQMLKELSKRWSEVKEEKLELKEIPVCCGKKMFHNPTAFGINSNETQAEFWICFECGRFITLKDEVLDEDELENYKENYQEKR